MVIKVLIVDDSSVMRRLIRQALLKDTRLEVVGEANDPIEARSAIKVHNPDVLILDIEMPRMSGLEFLELLMRLRPMPVVMFSSLARSSRDATIRALSLGAVDCIEKPSAESGNTLEKLPDSLVAAASADIGALKRTNRVSRQVQSFHWNSKPVLIGASTGGVDALQTVFSAWPENCPPTLVTQHMPENFLRSFANRLDEQLEMNVRVAGNNEEVKQGEIVICPGGAFHLELVSAVPVRVRLVEGAPVSGHRPSVDVMMRSAKAFGPGCVAAILTGMGRDGAQGLLELRQNGAETIGQDEMSSVVYGMPRVAQDIGAVKTQLPLDEIGAAILGCCSRRSRAKTG
ncbi:chemotaxis response regulator protein-glutamate methylesterase [Thalassobius sp. I31.1]|uniref:protein-glutamate methylesterase/protein-glutamine glutaminase n=1 Tax=Thalassobius sp. I31.1 TaxID=2109912 RepID=UPI000D1AC5E3|nr:chemotaxis response regulator protein-glutamate methylesterase [Thalassobius sp. I31.1]